MQRLTEPLCRVQGNDEAIYHYRIKQIADDVFDMDTVLLISIITYTGVKDLLEDIA